MRKFVFAALAAAAFLPVIGAGERAEAMTAIGPSALAIAATPLAQPAHVVCGTNGCSAIQKSRSRHARPAHP